MKLQENSQDNVKDNDNDYFLLVNFSVLQDIFEEVSRCPDCDDQLTLSDNLNNRMGMTHNFELNFNVCSYEKKFVVQNCQTQRTEKQKDVKHLRLVYVLLFPFVKTVVVIDH